MIKILFYLFIFSCQFLIGQNRTIDSLKNKIESTTADSTKIDLYIHLAKNYRSLNVFEKTIYYDKKAYDLSYETKDYKLQKRSLKYLCKDYTEIGSTSLALTTCMKGISISEKTNDSLSLGIFYNMKGGIYMKDIDYKTSLIYFLKANEILKNKDENDMLVGIYNNIGICYRNLENNYQALKYYNLCISLAKHIKDERVEMQAYNNLAAILMQNHEYEESDSIYKKSLDLAILLKDKIQEGIVLGNLGYLYFEFRDFKKAEAFMLQSLQIAKENDDTEGLLDNYKNLSDLYNEKGDLKKALSNYKLYVQAKIKFDDELLQQDLQKEEMKHSFEKEILNIEKADAIKDEQTKLEKTQSKIITYTITFGFLIVVVFFLILFNRFKIIKSQKNIIECQKKLVDVKQKEILDSIHYAKRIQNTLLAHNDFVNANIKNNFILYKPKDIVSGDFYWATKKNNLFYIAVCDSTGHGVPGAFMSLLNIGFLNEAINEKNISEPHEIFNYVRNKLVKSISKDGQQDGFDGILLCINQDTKEIRYSAAYNAPIIISNNEVTQLTYDKMPVGKGSKENDFQLYKIELKPNDTLYLYTDGYADQFGGPKGKKFMIKQLNQFLANISSKPIDEQNGLLDIQFEEWKGNLEQVDDVLVIGIKL